MLSADARPRLLKGMGGERGAPPRGDAEDRARGVWGAEDGERMDVLALGKGEGARV